MYKKILIASLALTAGLASCKKDDPTPSPNPPSGLTIDGVASTLEFYQLDTAHLSVAGVAKDAAAKAVWAVNGAKAAEGATFDFTTAHPGKYEVTLTSTARALSTPTLLLHASPKAPSSSTKGTSAMRRAH